MDGNYFHGDKNMYEELNPMQTRNKKNDLFKDVIAKGYGYKIERVWENDLKKNYEEVKKQFREILNIY